MILPKNKAADAAFTETVIPVPLYPVFQIIDNIRDCSQILGIFSRDVYIELILQRHHNIETVKRICTEIIHETGSRIEFILLNFKMIRNNLCNAVIYHTDYFLQVAYQ